VDGRPHRGTNAFLRHIPNDHIGGAGRKAPVLGAVFNPATGEFFRYLVAHFLNVPIKVTLRDARRRTVHREWRLSKKRI
jgi:hypothetical protein